MFTHAHRRDRPRMGSVVKRYRDITDPSLAKALAHPLRTRILSALEDRTASPSELATELGAPLGVVSYHVRRLAALRFLKLVKRIPRRGAVEHYYTAVAGPHITSAAWGSTPTVARQAMISTVLADVGRRAADAASTGGFDDALARISRTPLTLDQEGWEAAAKELDAVLRRFREIEAESAKRLAGGDHAERRADAALMLFEAPASGAAARRREPRADRARARNPLA